LAIERRPQANLTLQVPHLIGLFSLHSSEKVLCMLIAVLRLNDVAIQSRSPRKSKITLVLPLGIAGNMSPAVAMLWRP
jgi:hypothetical protein